MRRALTIFPAILLWATQSPATEQALAIGAKATAEVRRHARHRTCMTHSAQLDPCSEETIGGIKYTIAYRKDTGELSYISTNDSKFQTQDGLRVGATVDLTRDQVQVFLGWEVRGPASSDGWQALFGIGIIGITVVRDGRDVWVKDDQSGELLDKVFVDSSTATFRIVGFVQSR